MKKTCVCALLAVLVLSLALAGCTPAAAPTPAPEPIKIAILGPLSGDVKVLGDTHRDGALLAIDEWTAKGGILGRPIEPVIGDTKCDPKEAADVANKVVFQDQVHYIVGAICSSASIPISEITNPNHVIQVTWSTNPAVTEREDGSCKEYTFRTAVLDTFVAESAAKFVMNRLNAKTAAVLFDTGDDFVKGLAEFFRESFTDLGGEVQVYEAYTKDDTDFSGLLTKVANAGVDVIYLPDRYPKANLVGAQARDIALDIPFFGADVWMHEELDMEAQDGAHFATLYSPEAAEAQDFVKAYSEKYGKEPDMSAAYGYDGAKVLLMAIEEAGVDDPEKVREILASMQYDGVTGRTEFGRCNNPTKPVFIYQIDKDQGYVFVEAFAQ